MRHSIPYVLQGSTRYFINIVSHLDDDHDLGHRTHRRQGGPPVFSAVSTTRHARPTNSKLYTYLHLDETIPLDMRIQSLSGQQALCLLIAPPQPLLSFPPHPPSLDRLTALSLCVCVSYELVLHSHLVILHNPMLPSIHIPGCFVCTQLQAPR